MEGHSEDELQPAARELDEARESYRLITLQVEEYDPDKPEPGQGAQDAGGDAPGDDADA